MTNIEGLRTLYREMRNQSRTKKLCYFNYPQMEGQKQRQERIQSLNVTRIPVTTQSHIMQPMRQYEKARSHVTLYPLSRTSQKMPRTYVQYSGYCGFTYIFRDRLTGLRFFYLFWKFIKNRQIKIKVRLQSIPSLFFPVPTCNEIRTAKLNIT